jgi:alpha-tubulin suppressor-like RCC1 family protein
VAGASIAWSSGATGVATIDPDGWVHPVANGNTLVTATANGIIATGSVTVAIASPGSFTLIASPDTALIPPPYTAEPVLSARVVDEFGATVPGRTFTWRFLNYASDYSLVSLGAPGEDSVRVTPPYYGASGRRILLVEVTSDVLADTVVVFLYAPRQWLSIAAGRAHTCGAVYSDVNPGETEVYCWGDNSRAQLGQPASVTDSPLPVRVPFDSLGFTSLSAGDDFTCGRGNGSLVHCWGSNEFGQLGGASAESCAGVDCSHDAIRVGSTVAAVISAGPEHACLGIPQVFIFGSGTPPEIHCWGRNQGGQLGLDSVATAFSSSPGQVAGLPVVGGIQSVSAFGATSCAVIGGRRYCWGRNGAGQYGMATTTSSPVPVGSPVPTSSLLDYDLEGGDAFQCGNVYVTGDSFGLLSCWGSDALGQTGLAASFPRDTCGTGSTFPCVTTALVAPLPRPLFGGLPLNASSPETWQVGAAHVCAASGGNLYCWGDNAGGQLGDGSRSTRAQPVQIALPAGTINRVTAGRTHTCVDIEGEGLYCWGTGGNGRLGDGTRLDRLAPVRVQDP